jgi:hypothetical protein
LLAPSWWLPKPNLEQGERLIWSVSGNRMQGPRPVGGRLFVTDRRVIFAPNLGEKLLKGKRWEFPRSAIEALTISGQGRDLSEGGLRRRITITTVDGEHSFLIAHADRVVTHLREALGLTTS